MQSLNPHSSAQPAPCAVHPWRRRFSRQKRRFVASPLSAAGAPPTLPSIEAGRTTMTKATRLFIFTFALAVNAAAVSALHVAMVHGAEQAVLANQEYDHVVVSATRTPSELAKSSCPGTKAL
jgi:hypothetical protein